MISSVSDQLSSTSELRAGATKQLHIEKGRQNLLG